MRDARPKRKRIMKRHTFHFAIALAAGTAVCAVTRALRSRFVFRGKSVVLTGGSRGLGLALARQLAGEGARLAIFARDEVELARAAADLHARGAKDVLPLRCDVCDEGEVQRAVAQVAARFGGVDALINNAGAISVGPVEMMTREDFSDAMAIHFHAPLNTIFAALPHLRASGDGRIVNVASFGGKVAVPHLAPYCASKFALVGLSDALRAELAKDRIAVTTVCPGLMRTGSHLNATFKGEHEREFAWFSAGAALPVFSMNAERAARQILSACRRGQPELIITVQAKLAVLAQALFPNTVARILALINSALPGSKSADAATKKTGWQSRADWMPEIITRLADQATERLNGLRGHSAATLK